MVKLLFRRTSGISCIGALLTAALSLALTAFPVVAAPAGSEPTTLTIDSHDAVAPYDLGRARAFVNRAGREWITSHNCSSCHSTLAAIAANAGSAPNDDYRFVSAWVDKRAKLGDAGAPLYDFKRDESLDTEAILTALSLATRDARATTPTLAPATRLALDRVWDRRTASDGAWHWLEFPSFIPWETETDGYAGAALAVLATGTAPGDYAATPKAAVGLAALKTYFHDRPAPNLHHDMILLWASSKVPGFLEPARAASIVAAIRAHQLPSGGWSLPGLYGKTGAVAAASDGYGTGLALLVLRSAGVAVRDPQIARGVAYLRANQRTSGAWPTPSVRSPGETSAFLTHMGTAFAIMGLDACAPDRRTALAAPAKPLPRP